MFCYQTLKRPLIIADFVFFITFFIVASTSRQPAVRDIRIRPAAAVGHRAQGQRRATDTGGRRRRQLRYYAESGLQKGER